MDLDRSDRAHGAKGDGPHPAADAELTILVPAPSGFTFLGSIIGQIATKTVGAAHESRIQESGYLNERFFSVARHQAASLETLACLLRHLEEDSRTWIDRPLDVPERRR